MPIRYTDNLDGITADMLVGFFVGWPSPPSADKHLESLRESFAVELAIDDDANRVIGFINAISDGVLSAYIPLLEVLPDYQGLGIGSALVKRLVARLDNLYMIDLVCDEDVGPFYDRLALMRLPLAMGIRNRAALAD